MSSEIELLEIRIRELEAELAERERDLETFRKELTEANFKMHGILSAVQKEIDMASRLQRVLVPTEFPNIPGFEFSTKFVPSLVSGGDYFDIFEHEDKLRFGMILASSSGYAMSALLLSVFLKMTGQIEAKRGKAPHEVLQSMITEIQLGMSELDKASLFYAVFDRRRYEVTYCSVGEIVSIHHNWSEKKLFKLKAETESLTMNFRKPLQSHLLSLNPRDRLILTTPGLINVASPKGESFGLERMSQAIQASQNSDVHELRNEILFQAYSHAKADAFQRDVSVIVTEVKDRVIKLAKSPPLN